MEKQTAVEFLEKLWKQEILLPYSFTIAKEMEKQQIIDAFDMEFARGHHKMTDTQFLETLKNKL